MNDISTYIGNVIVNTPDIRIAMKVAAKVQDKDAVRGVVQVEGVRYRWSTIQQFEYHGGFTAKRGGAK